MKRKDTILVVDDEPDVRLGLRIRLEANGYEVIEAKDGEKGLDMAREMVPALIVLDLMLPGMQGYEVAMRLNADKKCRGIPVVMLTARSEQGERRGGFEAGAHAYITKPYDPQELLKIFKKLLAK